MRTTNSIWKRLLSMALVLFMVLGFVPVPVLAEAPDVLMKAKITRVQYGGNKVSEESEETYPISYSYAIAVVDKDGNDVTDADIVWSSPSGSSTESTYATADAENVTAVVTYNGMKLMVDTLDTETSWTATVNEWLPITAGNTITAPAVNLGMGCSFETNPVWSISGDGSDTTAAEGAIAKVAMGTLTARIMIGGKEYTRTTTVVRAPITVVDVQPVAGWYAAMPASITVKGQNSVTLEDSEEFLEVNGIQQSWSSTQAGEYTCTFAPSAGTDYSIGGMVYSWSVDDITPAIGITSAFVNDANQTVVNYKYTVGPSGGSISVNGTSAGSVGENTDEAGSFILGSAATAVKAVITNNVKDGSCSAESEDFLVTQRPDVITCDGYISKTADAVYVTDDANLTFTMNQASGNITWKVNGTEQPDITGSLLSIPARDYVGGALTISASDALGRTREITLPVITLDDVAPVITISVPDDEPALSDTTTHFNADRTYTIKITDNTGVIDTDTISVSVDGVPYSLSFTESAEGYIAALTLTNGQSLRSITVNANDKAGNPADEQTLTTNVCVDTAAPKISGSISVHYADSEGNYTVQGEIRGVYVARGNTYLILDTCATNDPAATQNVKISVDYILTEANPNAETASLWTDGRIHKEILVTADEIKEVDLSVTAVDKAGNVPIETLTLNDRISLTPSGNGYTGKVFVDRRAPEDQDNTLTAPKVTLLVTGENSYRYNGKRYFKEGDIQLEMSIKDETSGLSDADIVVETSGTGFTYPTQTVHPDADGKASITIAVASGAEYSDGVIGLKIYDNVGNYYFYTENFAVDSLAPRVSVRVADGGTAKNVGGVDFYQNPVTLEFAITDMLPATADITYTIDNGNAQTLHLSTDSSAENTITLSDGQKLTSLEVVAKDALLNETTSFAGYSFTPIKVDGTAPMVTVSKSVGTLYQTTDGVEYYRDTVRYTVTVSDADIDTDNGNAKLTYSINDMPVTINLLDCAGYTYTVEVTDGQALTGMSVVATDNAGNSTTQVSSSEWTGTTYSGNKMAVDNTAPAITVTKQKEASAQYIQTVDGKAYYKDGSVTYTVTIKDSFLDPNSAILFNNDSSLIPVYTAGGGPLCAEDTLTLSFTVKDENDVRKVLESITIQARDMVGLTQDTPVVADDVMPVTDITFQANNGIVTYTGPQVIVDCTAPTATMSLSGNIAQLVKKNGVYYAQLNQPTEIEGSEVQGNAEEEIVLKITVKDLNLALVSTEESHSLVDGTFVTSGIQGKNWTLAGNTATYIDSVRVGLHQTGLIELNVSAFDLVGHPIELQTITHGEDENEGNCLAQELGLVDGTVDMTFVLDRRTPSSTDEEVPKITLTDNASPKFKTLSDLDLYGSEFNFILNVKDGKKAENHAGLAKVSWKLLGINIIADGDKTTTDFTNPWGDYTENIGVNPTEIVETDSARLEVSATDAVGNQISYFKNFAFDNQAPRVSVSFTGDSVMGNKYYNMTRTATVEVVDMHMPELSEFDQYVQVTTQGTASGWEQVSDSVYRNTYTFAVDGEYSISVTAKDVVGNVTTNDVVNYVEGDHHEEFVIDKTAPVLKIKKTAVGTLANTVDGVEYYTGDTAEVEYKITVSDKNLDNNITDNTPHGSASVTYTIDNSEETVDLLTQQGYTFTFAVEEGHALECMMLSATDNAGNQTLQLVDGNGNLLSSTANSNAVITYDENRVAVDNTKPVITVEKKLEGDQAAYVQTYNDTAYYKDGQVTYTVTITDKFLSKDSYIKFNENITSTTADYISGSDTLAEVDKLEFSFTAMEDGEARQILESITILALDMANQTQNTPEVTRDDVVTAGKLTVTDTTFIADDGVVSYNGPRVIVDCNAPTARLSLSGDIACLVEKNGVFYVRLNAPVEGGADGSFSGADTEEIVLTLTVKDLNLALVSTGESHSLVDGTFVTSVIQGKKWTLAGNTATYSDSVRVGLHQTGLIELNVSAFDLVGHPITVNEICLGQDAGEGRLLAENLQYEGIIQKTFSLDRRTPSSTDEEVPKITLTDNASPKFKTLSDLDLYGSEFNFILNVKDGKKAENHAGLAKVSWKLLGIAGGDKTTTDFTNPWGDYTENIGVNPTAEIVETDSARLEVSATDAVGNQISYFKNFAFDNRAPRVTVTFSEKSVRGNNYYNQDRTAVIEIQDIHMPELSEFDQYVQVTTQGTASGWEQVSDSVYRNTYTFAVDGEYTFSMTAKDIVGNTTGDNAVQYVGENPKEFVIDKTAPVIAVNFNPATPSGVDGRSVNYYNQNVLTTVTITELNFQAADVSARFTPTNLTLGNWSSDIDHRSSITFPEGNNYSFVIDFQDLAGNKAETYTSRTFSVDTTAPTITVSRGDLSNEGLNVVPDDLVLSLTINDEQKNLSDYLVTVTHLDNTFKETTVTGTDYYSVDTQEERTTVVVNFSSIAKQKQNDGLYTVEITAKDYAGNTVTLTPSLLFSLNRFGSTFTTDDSFTLDFLTTGVDGCVYHNSVDSKLVIQEINPNVVWRDSSRKEQGSVLTVVVNGTSTQLEEGKDYKMSVAKEGSVSSNWYVYTYEIDPSVFRKGDSFVDGRYSILIYGEDEAGNKNTNESNAFGNLQKNVQGEYSGKIEFTLDTTPPIISMTGIESDKTYNAAYRRLDIFLSDNTPTEIAVYLNDQVVPLSESRDGLDDGAIWLVWNSASNSYILNVPEQTSIFGSLNIRVVTTDAAGNVSEETIEGVHISTNLFVRLLNNTWVVVGVPLLMIGTPVSIILLKKRKRIFQK